MLDEVNAFAVRPTPPVGTTAAGGNRLLEALPPEVMARLLPVMRHVNLAPGQVVAEPGEPASQIVFPGPKAVLALLSVLPDRRPVETACVGCEGMVGPLLGRTPAPAFTRATVLTGGPALLVGAEAWGEAIAASPEALRVVSGYAAAFVAQLQQGVACAALHPVEQRACRWMLMLEDRLGERSLPLTQEALADLLGVRRTTITRVIANLEAQGLVRHRRSRIIVVDRPGLERASCECHGAVRDHFAKAAPGLYPGADAPLA